MKTVEPPGRARTSPDASGTKDLRSSWNAHAYRPGDEIGINALLMRVFGIERSIEEWRWRFQDGPLGDRSIMRLASEGERIVGQYAVVFCRFLCGGREVIAAQPVDNMIDPDWRGGLGKSRMQLTLYRQAEEDPAMAAAAIAYGFPNREAYRIGRKMLGYTDLGDIDLRMSSLTWARHARRIIGDGKISGAAGWVHARLHREWIRLRPPSPPGIFARRIDDFDDRFDRLWARASKSFGVLAIRDRRHLQWRYGQRPAGSYRILIIERGEALLGYAVLTIRDNGVRFGRIADMLTVPGKAAAQMLIRSVLDYFLREGCDMAECWSVPGGRYEDLLRRYFPRVHPEPVRAVIRVYDPALDPAQVLDISRWHLTPGDSDSI